MKTITRAVWARQKKVCDPEYERAFAKDAKARFSLNDLRRIYSQYKNEDSDFALIMRRIIFRAMCKALGDGVVLAPDVGMKHPETFKIGNQVFIGSGSYLQGRFDGTFSIGDHTWIGPHCYFDARALKIGNYVGIGPGTRVLTSEHTGLPVTIPILQTDLLTEAVVIKNEADIGTGSILLKGVTIGKGSIIGANSLVNRSIPDYAVAVGSPAKVIRFRKH